MALYWFSGMRSCPGFFFSDSSTARSAQLKRAGWAVSTVTAGWDVPAAAGSGGWLVWSQVLSPAG